MTLCRNVQDRTLRISPLSNVFNQLYDYVLHNGRSAVPEEPRCAESSGPTSGTELSALLLRGGAHWDVRLEETPHLVDRALSQFLRLLPRIDRDLGVRRQ